MKKEFLLVVLDEESRKYYVHRPDCPGEEWSEITLGGAVDLMRNIQRYECDAQREKHSK
jgi:hypothetical protein